MAIPRSQAFGDLKDRLKEVRDLVSAMDVRGGIPPKPTLIVALGRASIVMTSSHFEGFIKDLVVEFVDFVDQSGIPANSIPVELRAAHCENSFRDVVQTEDFERRAQKIDQTFSSLSVLWSSISLRSGTLDGRCVANHLGNPYDKAVARVFTRLGIPDVFGQLRRRFKKRPETVGILCAYLKELVDKRNSIAHGNQSTFATMKDVRRYLAVVLWLARLLDREAGDRLRELTGLKPWT